MFTIIEIFIRGLEFYILDQKHNLSILNQKKKNISIFYERHRAGNQFINLIKTPEAQVIIG
jgi:hypothetical protein